MANFGHLKQLWGTWELRSVILISLMLQIFLIFSAPWRKCMSTPCIVMLMWLAYLSADLSANFAVGLISQSQGTSDGPFPYPTLLAFWAPFLMVHLGGPDTITAFSLEDNELWLRHLFGLVFQCGAVGYIFFKLFRVNNLWLPTVLMFIAGFIKYIERTFALYSASSHRFKDSLLKEPDPGPNYAKLMDEYTSKDNANLPTVIEMIPEPSGVNITRNEEDKEELSNLSDLMVVQHASKFFDTFKGLISDLIFSFRERNQSRHFFINRTPRDAFKVVEVELNFFYEVLYTKATVVHGWLQYPLRLISFCLCWAAIALFYNYEKTDFRKIDIEITYTLLLGAIALDLVAFLMVLYSDWTVVTLAKYDNPNWVIKILKTVLNVDGIVWPKILGNEPKLFSKFMQIVRLRWSESLSQYNLIEYCIDPRVKWWEKIIGGVGLTNMLDGMKYVNTVDFNNDLRDLIFRELKMKSELAEDLGTAKEIFSARGDWILRFESCSKLLRWINDIDFDKSLIMWHIATELCYNTDDGSAYSANPMDVTTKNKESSKLLSDYMLYLLIQEDKMLSPVAGIGQIVFRDTCAEAKKFFRGREIGKSECCPNIFSYCKCFCLKKCCCKWGKGRDKLQRRACETILAVDARVEPVTVKGDRSKSVLFDACRLAKELKDLGMNKMWEIVSKVWVELLSYAASHCRAYTHAAQLNKGGQLLTLVWLLVAHLGLGNQFQISEGHARAKLIVGK